MAGSSDKHSEQGPAPGPLDKVFLTSILTRYFCPPGTNKLRHQFELKFGTDLHGMSSKQSLSNRSSPQSQMHEVVVPTIARITRLPITDECAGNESQIMQFIDGLLSRIVEGDIEYQAINGDGSQNNIRGLFFHPAEPDGSGRYADPHYKLTCKRTGEDLVEFLLRALAKYRRPCPDGVGREPTHIILPVSSWKQRMSRKNQSHGHPLASDLDKLWNLQILPSDFVPEGRGLVLDIDNIALVLADGISWEFGEWPGLLKGYSTISVTHKANLLIKYPRSIMILDGLEKTKGTEQSWEARKLLEDPVIESTLPVIEEKLSLRAMLINNNKDILRHSGADNKGRLDLSAAYGDNANQVQDGLRSRYEKIGEIDCLIENIGNKWDSTFIIAKSNQDRDTYEYNRHQDWLERFRRGGFIFRGQSGTWPVTSSLYRSLLRIGKGSCLHSVGKKILTAAGYLSLPHTPESEIFADLQHFGGMTNYIDFTTDFTTALYFACKDDLENDGEVFIVRPNDFPVIYPIGQEPEDSGDSDCEYTSVVMAINHLNIRRAEAQRNVFIRPDNGYIDSNKFFRVEELGKGKTEDFMVLTIKAEEKRSIMGFLRRYGYIEKMTFFEDIIGIIERDRGFDRRSLTNEDILLKLDQYDNMEREIRRHRALAHIMSTNDSVTLPENSPRYHIGRILYSRGCYKKAVREFVKAEACYKPLAAPPHLYLFLASAYVKLKDYPLALKQLTNVKEESRDDLYHFIAADARFWMKDYEDARQNIEDAVKINKTSMTYLRLKILIAHELKDAEEVESCANEYFKYCSYDPEITNLRNQYRSKTKRR